MSQHPIEGLMDVTLEKIKSMVDSNTIIGNPINMADGTLVLPISKVTFGFASGGADFPSIFLFWIMEKSMDMVHMKNY